MRTCSIVPLLVLVFAATSDAAVISVRPVLVGVLDEFFTPVDPSLIVEHDPLRGATLAPRDGHYVLWVDVIMNIDNLLPNERGFLDAEFNLGVSGMTTDQFLPNWAPDTSTLDSNGTLPGGRVPKWAFNYDAGTSDSDLQGIFFGSDFRVVYVGTGPDPRQDLGKPPFHNDEASHPGLPGEYVGSVYLDYFSVGGETAVLELETLAGNIYVQGVGVMPAAAISGGRLIMPIPEPATAVLFAVASLVIGTCANWRRPARSTGGMTRGGCHWRLVRQCRVCVAFGL